MFKSARKNDLLIVATELGRTIPPEVTISVLRELIVTSKDYLEDPEFVGDLISSTVEERKRKEEIEDEERNRTYELEQLRLNSGVASGDNGLNVSQGGSSSNVLCLEKLLKSVRSLTIPVPSKQEGWNIFFNSIERAFKMKNVPENFQSEILINILGEKAANFLIYISDDDLKDYQKVKSITLREYQPTPQVCWENFKKAKRDSNESHVQFASRLATNFDYYCQLRDVNDFESLKSLIVSDKLYQSLDNDSQTYIACKQGENWLKPSLLGKEIDIYYPSKGKSLTCYPTTPQRAPSSSVPDPEESNKLSAKYVAPHLREGTKIRTEKGNDNKQKYRSNERTCWICGELHLARFCKNKFNKDKNKDQNKIASDEIAMIARVTTDTINVSLNLLERVNLIINNKPVNAILDSACQIMTVNERCFPFSDDKNVNSIKLCSAFGEIVEAKLSCASVSLNDSNEEVRSPIDVLLAVTDKLHCDCLLPTNIYDTLTSAKFGRVEDVYSTLDREEGMESVYIPQESSENTKLYMEHVPECSLQLEIKNDTDSKSNLYLPSELSETGKLKKEQFSCSSLEKVRLDLNVNKGKYFLLDGLIYHREINSCTTGISPFRLLYGREVRGPLAVLQSTWNGELPVPINLNKSAVEYLQELKCNLERAADLADVTAKRKQSRGVESEKVRNVDIWIPYRVHHRP